MLAGRRKLRGTLFIAVLVCCATFATKIVSAAATSYYWNLSDGAWDDSTANWNSPLTGSLPLVGWSDDGPTDDSTAIFSGATAGTVTLGATVNPAAIEFNTSGYILAAPNPNSSSYQINLAGAAPAINVGAGNAAFTDTINANVESTSSSAPFVLTDSASGAAAVATQLNFGGSLTVDSGSLRIVGNAIASKTGTPSTFTVSAPSLSLQNLTFNSGALNNVTLSGPSGSTLTLSDPNPSINVGLSNGTTTTGLIATINQNVATTGSNPLVITNYSAASTATAPWPQQLNLGGPSSTVNIASQSLQITNPTTAGFAVNAPSFMLQTLTFLSNSAGTAGNTDLGPVGGYTGGAPTSTLTFTSPNGVSPTIYAGSAANTGVNSSIAHLYETIAVTPNATNSPLVIDNLDPFPSKSAVSFGYATSGENVSTVSQNSFPTGIALYAASSTLSYDTSLATASGTIRLNFNLAGASGTGAGAGPISVFANGAIISDEGSLNAFTLTVPNNLVLNAGSLTPANGDFVTAIGGTKPTNGSTTVIYTGVIVDPLGLGTGTGVGDVLIGNDLVEGSGGAGLTEFSNVMKYSGKTIVNASQKGVLQLTVANALPSGTTVVFGHSSPHDTAPLANTIGAIDLNGFSQTITSLQSDVNPSSVIAGISNSSTSATTPILTITGSTVDWYTGGIGVVPAGSGFGAGLNVPASNNNLGLTRAGSGTTILGSTNSGTSNAPVNPSKYSGPTIVGDPANESNNNATSTLAAASTQSFSPNSNYTVYGTLDLGNYNNTINSLASASSPAPGMSSAGATGAVTTSAGYTISFGTGGPLDTVMTNPNNPSAGATLTIGSLTTANSNTTPLATFYGVLEDGTGGPLSLTKAGLGTQVLAGKNTYTGPTTVTGGTLTGGSLGTLSLASTGSLSASSAVTVSSNGTLAGSGDAQGPVTIKTTGVIAPGSSTQVGNLSVGSLTLFGGSVYNWKISDASGSAGSGFDTVTSTGGFVFDSSVSSSSPVTVNITSLGLTNFTNTNQQSWPLVVGAGAVSGFSSSDFNVVATNFTAGNLFSNFTVSNPSSGPLSGGLVLTYNPGSPPAFLTWVGGAGNWAPSGGISWNNGSGNGPWNSANGADFTTGSGTVTLTGAIAAPLIQFDVDGYTIGGTSALTASGGFTSLTVQVTNSGTAATINAPINSPLTKIGAGTLVLGSTSSTFGTANSATVTLGTLQGTTASLTAANINNNSTVVFDQATSGSYAGTISGGGQVIVQNSASTGSPVVQLTGSNSYNGGTTVSSNTTLSIASNGNIGGASAGLTLNGGTLRTTPNTGVAFGGALNVTASGGTIIDASQASITSFAGGATLAPDAVLTKNGPGRLRIDTNAYTGSGSIVIAAGSLQVGDETDVNSNPSTFLGGNSLTLGSLGGMPSTTTLTIAAASDSGASITPPNLNLNGNVNIALYNTGPGGPLNPGLNSTTTINPGSSTASSTILIANSGDGGNLNGRSNVTLGNTTFAPTSGTITIQTIADNGLFFGNPSGAATGLTFGAVADNGDATIFLGQGDNNQTTPVPPGPGVQFNGVPSGTIPTLTGSWTIGDPGDTNGQIVVIAVQETNKAQLAMTTGNITVNPGSQLSITPNTGVYGPASGTQTITLYGSGPVGSKSGATTEALSIGGKSTVEFNSNVDFVLGSSVMVNGVATPTGHVEISLSDGSGTKSTVLQFDGPISGSASLHLQGGSDSDNFSQVIFGGNNSGWTGGTTIEGGEVIVQPGSSIGTGSLTMGQTSSQSPILVFNNAAQSIKNLSSSYGTPTTMLPVTQTIQLNGTALTINETDVSGMADYGSSANDNGLTPPVAGSQSIITGSGSLIYSGASAGNGNLAAYLSLSSANTYFGGTTVTSGILATTLNGTLGTGPVSVTGGILDLSDHAISIGALTIGSGGTLNIRLGNLVTSTGAASFSGSLNIGGTPSGDLEELIAYNGVPTGAFATVSSVPNYALLYTTGQLDLVSYSAINAASGTTTTMNGSVDLLGGQLPVSGGGNTVINGSLLLDGAQVQMSNGSSVTINGQPILNGGSVVVNAGSTLTLNNNTNTPATGTGAVSVTVASGATLQLAGASSALTSAVNIANNASATGPGVGGLQVTGANQVVGVVSGTGATNPDGSMTYSGDTVVGPGASLTATQILQNAFTIGAGATVTIAPSVASSQMDAAVVGSTAAANDSASSNAAAANVADANDPLTVIQAAIAAGSISSARGQQLENRLAAIERLATTDPSLDVSLLESRILAAIPSPSIWSSTGSSGIGESSSSLLAADGSAFAAASASILGAEPAFSPAGGLGSAATAVPEPSSLMLIGLGLLGLAALSVKRRRTVIHLQRS